MEYRNEFATLKFLSQQKLREHGLLLDQVLEAKHFQVEIFNGSSTMIQVEVRGRPELQKNNLR